MALAVPTEFSFRSDVTLPKKIHMNIKTICDTKNSKNWSYLIKRVIK